MNDLIANITIITSLLTALAAVVSQPLVALINSRYQLKIKTTELFFNSKIAAYQDFLNAASSLSAPISEEALLKLYESSCRVLLLSSPETQACISAFVDSCLDGSFSSNTGEQQANVILAMQKDLYEFKKYRKLYRGKATKAPL